MTHEPGTVQLVHVEDIAPTEVVPGILHKPPPAVQRARGWVYDFAPGTRWPEETCTKPSKATPWWSGEFIDCGRRLTAGSFVVFAPGSTHRPLIQSVARMIGITLLK
ncbi:anti-sigma factor [Streptomyces yangpuensis]|uniref:anti-sigma factor n=1 Tax=Streptomyces yangpuensis TaxID=1648182 RepID=UPI003645FE67